MEKLTFTMENYLEAIYELSKEEETGARVSDIAERLGFTRPSTSVAMTTLSRKGLITNEKFGEIFLTPLGRKLAELTSRKHQIIRKFFIDILRIDPSIADADACAIEHVISSDSIQAMQEFLKEHKESKRHQRIQP
ncbi:MAG: metal-dependent transcriptional regulator [Smithella sp.]